jgi:hypothetical protein
MSKAFGKKSKKNTGKRAELIQRLASGEDVAQHIVNENETPAITGMWIDDQIYTGLDKNKKSFTWFSNENTADDDKPFIVIAGITIRKPSWFRERSNITRKSMKGKWQKQNKIPSGDTRALKACLIFLKVQKVLKLQKRRK